MPDFSHGKGLNVGEPKATLKISQIFHNVWEQMEKCEPRME